LLLTFLQRQLSDNSLPKVDLGDAVGSNESPSVGGSSVPPGTKAVRPTISSTRPPVVEPVFDDNDEELKPGPAASDKDNVFLEDFSNIHCRQVPDYSTNELF
jgi:hypothetical protein